MQLQVVQALRLPGEVFHTAQSEQFPVETFGGRQVVFEGPVELDADYSFDGKAFTVTGNIKAVLATACARCEKPFSEPLSIAFENRFVKGSPGDEECYAFEGGTLMLTTMVLDEIFLHQPIASLCSEDCRGLCPNCGCNLNTTQCACGTETPEDHPFSALRQLLDNGKEV